MCQIDCVRPFSHKLEEAAKWPRLRRRRFSADHQVGPCLAFSTAASSGASCAAARPSKITAKLIGLLLVGPESSRRRSHRCLVPDSRGAPAARETTEFESGVITGRLEGSRIDRIRQFLHKVDEAAS